MLGNFRILFQMVMISVFLVACDSSMETESYVETQEATVKTQTAIGSLEDDSGSLKKVDKPNLEEKSIKEASTKDSDLSAQTVEEDKTPFTVEKKNLSNQIQAIQKDEKSLATSSDNIIPTETVEIENVQVGYYLPTDILQNVRIVKLIN